MKIRHRFLKKKKWTYYILSLDTEHVNVNILVPGMIDCKQSLRHKMALILYRASKWLWGADGDFCKRSDELK